VLFDRRINEPSSCSSTRPSLSDHILSTVVTGWLNPAGTNRQFLPVVMKTEPCA
jgi:hypothetical protein